MRIFQLIRNEDVTGISGTGLIAEGIQFDTGKCALGWLTKVNSVGVYDSIEDVIAIHGHDGKTEVKWVWGNAGETDTGEMTWFNPDITLDDLDPANR